MEDSQLSEAKMIIIRLMDWIEDHSHKPNEITEFLDAKVFLKKLNASNSVSESVK